MKTTLCSLLLLLAACTGFDSQDTAGTLRARSSAMIAEATQIRDTLEAREASAAQTAVAVETHVIERNSVNQRLLATVVAGNPPTQQVIAINPEGIYYRPIELEITVRPTGGPTLAPGETPPAQTASGIGQFEDTVTARALNTATGCAQSAATTFTQADDRIYVVTRAVEIAAGTRLTAEWMLDGQTVDQAEYTTPTDERDYCIWFYLDTFSPGNWSVRLTASGVPIEPAPAFTVSE